MAPVLEMPRKVVTCHLAKPRITDNVARPDWLIGEGFSTLWQGDDFQVLKIEVGSRVVCLKADRAGSWP